MYLVRSEFFNLFSEAEPFSAILIAHGALGRTPEARRAEIRGQRPRAEEGSWGEDSEPPPHQLGVWGSTVSSPSGFGQEGWKAELA